MIEVRGLEGSTKKEVIDWNYGEKEKVWKFP